MDPRYNREHLPRSELIQPRDYSGMTGIGAVERIGVAHNNMSNNTLANDEIESFYISLIQINHYFSLSCNNNQSTFTLKNQENNNNIIINTGTN